MGCKAWEGLYVTFYVVNCQRYLKSENEEIFTIVSCFSNYFATNRTCARNAISVKFALAPPPQIAHTLMLSIFMQNDDTLDHLMAKYRVVEQPYIYENWQICSSKRAHNVQLQWLYIAFTSLSGNLEKLICSKLPKMLLSPLMENPLQAWKITPISEKCSTSSSTSYGLIYVLVIPLARCSICYRLQALLHPECWSLIP